MLKMLDKVIAIVNQKGGVGKTTSAVNLSTSLAAAGKTVLLIDLDPQANATSSFKLQQPIENRTTYEVLMGMKSIESCIFETQVPGLVVIPSKTDLAAAEIELVSQKERELWLKERWVDLSLQFDFIIMDCPPSNGLLSVNALVAAKSVLIPIQCEYFALEGLAQLVRTIDRIKNRLNSTLELEGILMTMFDGRNMLNRRVIHEVKEYFGQDVFETIIPRNVKLSEAPSFKMPGVLYDFTCAGSVAYMKLAREILERHDEREKEHIRAWA
jgi:chromosome partitioning protein